MSRVYRALEKAEEEKKRKSEEGRKPKEDPSLKDLEKKSTLKEQESILKPPEEKIKRVGFPPKEEVPVLTVTPNSYAAEEFRKLKTQIFHRLPNPPHSILITSTAPQEGKTMVSVNLAIAISQEINRKAILIDGDLRNPGIHLGKSQNSRGLSNYLIDGAAVSDILINSVIENLRIIEAGPSPSNSSELIASNRMKELLQSLYKTEDNTYIIIDSSPIISTSEPLLFSKMVDGVILVVMADRTPKEAISRAMKSLDRQKIVGVVLNQMDLKPSSYYSRYYKYYRK